MNEERRGVLIRRQPDFSATWRIDGYPQRLAYAELSEGLRAGREPRQEVIFEVQNGKPVRIRAADAAKDDRLAKEAEAKRAAGQAEAAQRQQAAVAETRSRIADETASRRVLAALRTPRTPVDRQFRNPYNFVPAPEPKPGAGALDQGSPVSLRRWEPDLWSGRLTLRLTAATPLLLPEAPEVDETQDGHKTFRTRREHRDGREYPVLPATTLKGALRSAVEAVTNSRFGEFGAHDRELGLRMPAGDGLRMVPARVRDDSTLELFMGPHGKGDWPSERNGRWSPPGSEMYAAWLPRYDHRGQAFRPTNGRAGVRRQTARDPEHGRKIRCLVQQVQRGPFSFWQVTDYIDFSASPALLDRTARAIGGGQYRPQGAPRLAWGYICATGQNIGKKHDERVFFVFDGAAPVALPLTKDLTRRYELLVRDYRRLHEENWKSPRKPWEFEAARIGQTAASRHVYAGGAERLKPEDLVYARMDANGHVEGLYPVTISRDLYRKAPAALLPESLRPARSRGALSPADRMFGWVMQGGDGGRRGQVRILPPRCETADAIEALPDGAALPLAILGRPKPEQARFYAAADRGGQAPGDGTQAADLYRGFGGLRGRKVYPHQRPLSGDADFWSLAGAVSSGGAMANGRPREFMRAGGTRDNQNRSISDWVRVGAVFSVEIEVFNLTAAELGALLFALGQGEDGAHLRLGGGKPLGFGSCAVAVEDTSLFTGAMKRRQLCAFALAPEADQAAVKTAMAAFRGALEGAYGPFDAIPFIAGWRKAAAGYADALPTHYPRQGAHPDPAGENYQWFVRNADPRRGHAIALAPLADDPGLPYDPGNG